MKNYKDLIQTYAAYQAEHKISGKPNELYDPIDYILNLGGKRIRPVLVLLGYNLVHEDIQPALSAAHAVELFHNFTLMHDDIMDMAEVRRGKPTVHKKWNSSIAILSGDLMLIKAYKKLVGATNGHPLQAQILTEFNTMAEEVCVGQQMDMNFEEEASVSESDYLEMIKLKTSVLLAYSLRLGGLLAGLSEENSSKLYDFGLNMGLAFQVMDDYLDTFGNPETFGKRIGGDIIENKKTLLFIEAMRQADDASHAELTKLYASTEDSQEKINRVTTLFKELKVDAFAKRVMQRYLEQAFESLGQIDAGIDTGELRNLASDLNQRSV